MKTYTRLLMALLFGALAVSTVSCAPKKNQKSRISSRNVRGGDGTGGLTQPPSSASSAGANKQWGEIIRSTYTQEVFQKHVEALVSNIGEDGVPVEVGTVSGDPGQNTGIRFWGGVQFQNGAFNRNGNNNLQINSKVGALRISIIDSYVGQVDANGENISEIPIYIANDVPGFAGVSGYVSGTNAEIQFSDAFGSITLKGTFNANWFVGYVKYDNLFYLDGTQQVQGGAAGYLGAFRVPTCGFFTCQ